MPRGRYEDARHNMETADSEAKHATALLRATLDAQRTLRARFTHRLGVCYQQLLPGRTVTCMRSLLHSNVPFLARLTSHRSFEAVSMVLILGNTILLCAYHHDMLYEQEQVRRRHVSKSPSPPRIPPLELADGGCTRDCGCSRDCGCTHSSWLRSPMVA